jgi:hypothetical protein
VLRLLGVVADEAGLPLVPEDLHWAAADTLGPVEFLADHLHSTQPLDRLPRRVGREAGRRRGRGSSTAGPHTCARVRRSSSVTGWASRLDAS